MKRTWLITTGIVLALVGVTMIPGCYYDNEEDLYPVPAFCDTVAVSYTAFVQPLLDANCNGCHSQSAAPTFGAGYDLETFAQLQNVVNSGQLLCSIKHDNGCSQMPKGAQKLPKCTIDKVEAWVNAGAPNN